MAIKAQVDSIANVWKQDQQSIVISHSLIGQFHSGSQEKTRGETSKGH